MPPSETLFKAIVRATAEMWQADAACDELKARAWTRELQALIAEYNTKETADAQC